LQLTVPQWTESTYPARPSRNACLIFAAVAAGGAIPLLSSSLMPLYGSGLWEAVMTMPPSQPSWRSMIPTHGVVTNPRSTTSTPTEHRPAVMADRSI
jgi:hypothetical protein